MPTFTSRILCFGPEAGANLAGRIGGRRLSYEGSLGFLKERRGSPKFGREEDEELPARADEMGGASLCLRDLLRPPGRAKQP